MSVVDALRRYATDDARPTDAAALRERAVGFAFGDRVGLAIFLASLCAFGLVWRTQFLITDSYTLANGLYAVERGSMAMTEAAYGPSLDTPGANVVDGQRYARNYGMIFAALPVLWAIQAVEAVADLRLALVAGWCLAALALAVVLGRLTGRERLATVGGSVGVLGVFLLNVAVATPVVSPGNHLLALQVVHGVAAAFVGVFTYRLVSATNGRRLGVLAAALVTLGTPLAFWATVPKRHVLTAAVVTGVAFALVRSRDAGDGSTRYRAAAYALVGLLAWVHAPEALLLWCGLVVVDVPTAPSNDVRTLAVVAGAFALSLVPFFVTNALVSGDPLLAPRLLRNAGSGAEPSVFQASEAASGGSAGGSGGGGSGGGGSGGGSRMSGWRPPALLVTLFALVQSTVEPLLVLGSLLADGVRAVVADPTATYHAFVRSGYVEGVAAGVGTTPAGANLALLESAPVLAGLVAVLPATVRAVRGNDRFERVVCLVRPVDAFVLLVFVGYALLYVSRLPLHAQVTVRYLFPLYPLGTYLLVRLPPVRRCLLEHWRTAAWTYTGGVLVGSQLLVVVLVVLRAGQGETFQFHALLGLACAAAVGTWALTGRTEAWRGRLGAAAIGLAAVSVTAFVLLTSLEYYALHDSHALPMMRALARLVTVG